MRSQRLRRRGSGKALSATHAIEWSIWLRVQCGAALMVVVLGRGRATRRRQCVRVEYVLLVLAWWTGRLVG